MCSHCLQLNDIWNIFHSLSLKRARIETPALAFVLVRYKYWKGVRECYVEKSKEYRRFPARFSFTRSEARETFNLCACFLPPSPQTQFSTAVYIAFGSLGAKCAVLTLDLKELDGHCKPFLDCVYLVKTADGRSFSLSHLKVYDFHVTEKHDFLFTCWKKMGVLNSHLIKPHRTRKQFLYRFFCLFVLKAG